MSDYRVYKIDTAGKIAGPAIILKCDDEDAALIMAQQHIDACALEIWAGDRRVSFIPADHSA
jgi:hypothetical protein